MTDMIKKIDAHYDVTKTLMTELSNAIKEAKAAGDEAKVVKLTKAFSYVYNAKLALGDAALELT